MEIGKTLKKLREKHGYTMTGLAHATVKASKDGRGIITQGYISRLEAGTEDNPSYHKLITLAKIFKTDVNTVCGWRGKKEVSTNV